MKKIIDDSAVPVPGLFRADSGSIVVSDKKSYIKYIQDRHSKEEVLDLKERIRKLELLIEQMVK